ncbi:hypothetical protein SAMCCGM7_pB0382 (plasmid) [Sinorhizobium americanum CCGM7]|nr:hypothetical protein SAMCCGM7_pB0382 [Sinorhizobium americanum CCGM7]
MFQQTNSCPARPDFAETADVPLSKEDGPFLRQRTMAATIAK